MLCVSGQMLKPKRRGELHPVQRQHPHPNTSASKTLQAIVLKVTTAERKLITLTRERWRIEARQPKQLLPRLFAFYLFRSYVKSSPALQLRRRRQSKQRQ